MVPLDQASLQEKRLVEITEVATSQMRRIVGNIAIAWAVCTIIVSILVGVYIIRGLTARVRKVVDNTKRLSAREPLQPPSEMKDEIGFVEQSFFDAANKLTQLEQYKQELIALTSHEFRTPLTSLLAKADLMEAGVFGPLNEHGSGAVVKVKRNIIDLIALLTNLLDVEKIQSGKSLVVKEKSSIDEVLARTIKNVAVLSADKKIDIRVVDSDSDFNVDARATCAVSDSSAYRYCRTCTGELYNYHKCDNSKRLFEHNHKSTVRMQ